MPLARRVFAQLVVPVLLLHHLPVFAQILLTVAIGDSPKPEVIQRVASTGAPTDTLLLVVTPKKLMGLSSFDFSRQIAIPFNGNIRTLPKFGRLAGCVSTLSPEALLALKPDLVIDYGNADEIWFFRARQASTQTQIPQLLINDELRHAPEQPRAVGEILGAVSRTTIQTALVCRFIGDAIAFSRPPTANLRSYTACDVRGLETGLQGLLHIEAAELLGLHSVAYIPGRQGLVQISMENLLSWQPSTILVQNAMTAQFLREDPVQQGAKVVADRHILFLSGLSFGRLDAPPGINRLPGLRRLYVWLDPQVETSFKADVQRYSELFWHTTLGDAQYQRLVAV